MTRMRFTFAPRAARSFRSVLPATIETTVCFAVRSGFTSAATASTSCGRTARKMSSHVRAISTLRLSSTDERTTDDVSAIAERMPWAILPAPRNPIFMTVSPVLP